MLLDERLAGAKLLTTPVWVFDTERYRVVWANRAALDLWRADSEEELFQRDLSNLSASAKTRNRMIREALLQGRIWRDEMTLYPRGQPARILCTVSGLKGENGSLHWLCEGHERTDIDPLQLRGVEALQHTTVMVAVVSPTGETLLQNYATQQAFGEQTSIYPWFTEPAVPEALLAEVAAGQVFAGEFQVETRCGPRWHGLEARSNVDPATGAPAVLLQQYDLTQRRERDALIEQQRQEILALSAPILEVAPQTLAVPIIGQLDRARGAQLTETLLTRVVEQQAGSVILDLTGASTVSASDLLSLVRALSLLDARPIITGVLPSLAHELIASEASLEGVQILRNLRQGIAACVGHQQAARGPTGRQRTTRPGGDRNEDR
ncbi:PAS domain-containing protein [Chondromyces crocatus]|uniref:Anti-anti sigma factor protein n=1 Tax=Chondromyces crocatus TaxID=52 RepID=A0A0K1EDI7_CHOCO|nr:PAS domain-containing protein [Chondromyces crocatus]AKT38941.1 anti-anti sigma factor protein [Chondromyces crocatus]